MDRLLLFAGVGFFALLSEACLEFFLTSQKRTKASMALGGLWFIHLPMGLVLVPLKLTVALQILGSVRAFAVVDFPADRLEEKNLVVLNSFDLGHAVFPMARELEGLPVPHRGHQMAPMSNSFTVERTGPKSLLLTSPAGFLRGKLDQLTRGSQHPFFEGYRRDCGLYAVTVEEVNEAGQPKSMSFVFDRNLESEDLVWIGLIEGRFQEWRPPELGRSEYIASPKLSQILSLIRDPQTQIATAATRGGSVQEKED